MARPPQLTSAEKRAEEAAHSSEVSSISFNMPIWRVFQQYFIFLKLTSNDLPLTLKALLTVVSHA